MTSSRQWLEVLSNPSSAEWDKAVASIRSLTPDSDVSIEPLIEGLDSTNSDIAFNCTIGLGGLARKAREAIHKLVRMASVSPNPALRAAAIDAIVEIDPGDMQVKVAVIEGFSDPDYEVRAEAVRAAVKLRKWLNDADLAKLRSLQKDDEYWVRNAAEGALHDLFPAPVAGRPNKVTIPEHIEIVSLAEMLVLPPMQVHVWLVSMGIFKTLSDSVDFESAAKVCERCGVTPVKGHAETDPK